MQKIWIIIKNLFIFFYFKLKPNLINLIKNINQLLEIKKSAFPYGKSIFVYNGKENSLYFVILKEENNIFVLDFYDDFNRKLPPSYTLLKHIYFSEILS